VLVQGAFDSAQGSDRGAELPGHGRRPRRGGFERRDTLAQNRQALMQERVGGWGISHGGLPEDAPQSQQAC